MRTTVGKKIVFGIAAAAVFTTMAVGAGSAASAAPFPTGGYDRYATQYQYGNHGPHYTRPGKPANTAPAAPATAPNTTAPVGSTANTTTAVSAPVQSVLTQINKLRAANGAKALTLNVQLSAAAHQHNLTMAGGCGLSHQCSGEGNAGTRISAQGLQWNAWAENIGYGSTSAATDAAHTATATRITQSMIDEVAPNDGHRRNILNPSLGRIGIDLYRDAKGTLWMTQDFSN